MISLMPNEWDMQTLAPGSRYKTPAKYLLEMYRDAKRIGFTHMSPCVYNSTFPHTLRYHVAAAEATGLRLIPWLIPDLFYGGYVQPRDPAGVRDMDWLIRDYWQQTGLKDLSDGYVICDDAGYDTEAAAKFRAAVSEVLPGVPLIVCVASSASALNYLHGVREPRPIVVPQLYAQLWRPDVIGPDDKMDETAILRILNDKLVGLGPQDGVCWIGFGCTDYALRMRPAASGPVPNWHFAPRPGEIRTWRLIAEDMGIAGPQFVWPGTWASGWPNDPWMGFYDDKKLMQGKTFAKSRAPFAQV